jgi:general secretion pathway protein H
VVKSRHDHSVDGEKGFALIEILCVLAIISMLAAIILPAFPRSTTRARLESLAVETAAILKADRSAALRRHMQVATIVDAPERAIRSGATGRILRLPSDVTVDAALAVRCADREAGRSIDFFPSGMSCGGSIALARPGMGYEIRVNWLTGGVEIVTQKQKQRLL